jgi:hypothetical protein
MNGRHQPEEITAGLLTISAKIRALAQSGHQRTEISKVLGIRYRHVRNVLVGSSSTEDDRPQVAVAREPVMVDTAPPPREDTLFEVLMDGGFALLGQWSLEPDDTIRLDAKASSENGVYAFVVDYIVVYVGLTNSGFRTTLDQYRRGDERQRTRARVKKCIVEALSKGHQVKVFGATPEFLEWNGLPVLTAAGLEAGLIRMIRPAWNITGIA